jgi:starch synthase (maltosyl-transferring)
MVNNQGKQRVIISNISPEIEHGQFPAKATVGELLQISADIFSDGHDEISANVYMRMPNDETWIEQPMSAGLNDRWAAAFSPGKTGYYQFRLEAWIDHYKTWSHGLKKKFDAEQDIEIELQIGAQLLEQAKQYPGADIKSLTAWQNSFLNPVKLSKVVQLAVDAKVYSEMYKHRDRKTVTAYPLTLLIEVERKKAAFSSWYELFPRSTAPEDREQGTFNDVINLLPRITKMGFDVLYFPPIHPIGEKNRKGKNNTLKAADTDPGSPWAIGNRTGGHKAIHPQLGTLADFKKLIKAARKQNIEISMDIAYQCAPDHPYVKEHPQWFKWRPDGTVQYAENPPKKYEDILPFNFETDDWQALWNELKSVIDYWIAAGVTIFRIDNPHTKAFPFWEWMIGEVRKQHPETLFLAEAFTRPRVMERLAKAGFNQSYTYFTWRTTKKEIEEYMTELTKTDRRYYFRPNFWPNTPDILTRELVEGGEKAHIVRVILAATLSSNYGIYGPVYEFGINQPQGDKEEYQDNEKYEIKHWDWKKYSRIGEIITRINTIRKANPALQSTWNIEFAHTSNDQIICYVKRHQPSGNMVVIAVNLDINNTQGAHVDLPFDKLGIKAPAEYRLNDLLSGEKYNWQNGLNYVELNPNRMPAHLFKLELLP